MDALAFPPLSLATQSLIRGAYGVLLLLTLAQALPQGRRFFVSDRWGGYAQSERGIDLVQNPRMMPIVLAVWFAAASALVLGWATVPAAFVNLVLCRYFFISMRWKGVLRGMGAPGFMTYWLAAAVFLLEFGTRHDPSGLVRDVALLAVRVDFAVIMICAGTYKVLAGYPRNDGMELGMINPWWGYWGSFYQRLRPGHWVFRTLNHLAYSTEIVAGVLMLFAPTQLLGAFLIFASFAFILTHIRLGFLCEMVMLGSLFCIPAGHPLDRWIAGVVPVPSGSGAAAPEWVAMTLAAALLGYVLLLPFAKGGQYYNFLARKTLPGVLQPALERYTNLFGIIIWRVFSVDVVNFFAHISFVGPTGARTVYARPGALDWSSRFRYLHVGEFICLASLFTTLKYYATNAELFRQRLVRYSRTLPCPTDRVVVFDYVSIGKHGDRFGFTHVASYTVDPRAATVREETLDSSVSVRSASPVSPVHEGQVPGSYRPAPTPAGSGAR